MVGVTVVDSVGAAEVEVGEPEPLSETTSAGIKVAEEGGEDTKGAL